MSLCTHVKKKGNCPHATTCAHIKNQNCNHSYSSCTSDPAFLPEKPMQSWVLYLWPSKKSDQKNKHWWQHTKLHHPASYLQWGIDRKGCTCLVPHHLHLGGTHKELWGLSPCSYETRKVLENLTKKWKKCKMYYFLSINSITSVSANIPHVYYFLFICGRILHKNKGSCL